MSYSDNIESNQVEKHTLIVISPRRRVTTWNNVSGNIWSTPFSIGVVSRVWATFANDDGLTKGTSSAVTAGQFYHDYYAGTLFVYSTTDPDLDSYPGRTVEFKLNLADKLFTAPCDPLDPTTQIVEWRPVLGTVPLAQNGSRDNLTGFVPMIEGTVSVNNSEGWMNEFLDDSSFNFGLIKAYIMASDEFDSSVCKQIFFGYTSGISYSGETVSITTTDLIRFLDRQVESRSITELVGSYVPDPESLTAGQEYKIREIFGCFNSYKATNIDYSSSFNAGNNRIWLTHARPLNADGTGYLSGGTLGYNLDSGQPNTATRTYTTTTHQMQVGDRVQMTRNSSGKFVEITAKGTNYFDHAAVTGTVDPGDTVTRFFIGWVDVEFTPGDVHKLYPGLNVGMLTDNTKNIRGFVLDNNFEGTYFATTPINPAVANITCRVYGYASAEQYSDLTDVTATVDNGGIIAKGVAKIYHLLIQAGFDPADIDEQSFKDATANSFSVGVSIPEKSSETALTYREIITKILSGNIYRLAFSEVGNTLKLSLIEIAPLPGTAEFSANDQNFHGFTYDHDYSDVYSNVSIVYDHREFPLSRQGESDSAVYISAIANDLHFKSDSISIETYLYDSAQAISLSNHYGYIFGDRRGFYKVDLGLEYLDKANLNSSYNISRDKIPGFSYAEGTSRTKKLAVIEATKSSNGVKLTFEDQRGIEENSGDW